MVTVVVWITVPQSPVYFLTVPGVGLGGVVEL